MAENGKRKKRPENSWEQQPEESAKAYEAFSLYLEMGANRSLLKVAQKLSKSETLMKRWSYTYEWRKRCRDYENDLKRTEYEQAKKKVREMQKRQASIAEEMQKKAYTALGALEAENLTVNEIIRLMQIGAELERTNRLEMLQQSDENGEVEYEDLDEIEGDIYGDEDD